MAVSQLAYVGIGVSDMTRWKAFASDVLGLQVATDAAYAQARSALRAAGVTVTQGTPDEIANRRVMDLVKFETGDLPFELAIGCHMRWDPPFRPGRPMIGFKTGELGFGHVVLRSETPRETVKLLTEVLGFRISDYIGTMTFLHCNPRHHSIAIQPRNPDLPRSRDKKMWHFMLETASLDDVGTALDLAGKTGAPLATTLGRHTNDQMVSFYVVTPSGFEVEYGWGTRLVDDATWQVQRHDRGGLWGHAVQLQPASTPPGVTVGR